MHMGVRPAAAPLSCPDQVLILEPDDFPLSICSAVRRARESSMFGRFGKIFWVMSPDNPNQVLRFSESELRTWLAERNNLAAANKQSS